VIVVVGRVHPDRSCAPGEESNLDGAFASMEIRRTPSSHLPCGSRLKLLEDRVRLGTFFKSILDDGPQAKPIGSEDRHRSS